MAFSLHPEQLALPAGVLSVIDVYQEGTARSSLLRNHTGPGPSPGVLPSEVLNGRNVSGSRLGEMDPIIEILQQFHHLNDVDEMPGFHVITMEDTALHLTLLVRVNAYIRDILGIKRYLYLLTMSHTVPHMI